MNSIKMIVLAALAALMAMAFVGASSAMALSTQLCSVDPEPFGNMCPAGNVITHVHETTFAGAKTKLLTSNLGTVECDALFLGDTLGLGEPLVIHGKFSYTNCVRGAESCTVTEVSTDALIKVLRTEHEKSEVTGEGKVKVVCGFFISCVYNGTGLAGTGKGPLLSTAENGEVTLSEQTVTKESGLCPETGKLDIRTSPLVKVYVAQ